MSALRAVLLALVLAAPLSARAAYEGPIFDAHLHYNDDAVERYSVGTVMELFSVVPFIRVCRDRADYGTWHANPDIAAMIEEEAKRGYYRGIGEFHIFGREAASEVVRRIVNFAVANDLVLHAHCDEELFARYPSLGGELSCRWDVAEEGRLAPAWKAYFTRHPDRFLVGSGTWVNQRWQAYPETMGHYRRWLGQLPPEVAARIAWGNGARLFGVE